MPPAIAEEATLNTTARETVAVERVDTAATTPATSEAESTEEDDIFALMGGEEIAAPSDAAPQAAPATATPATTSQSDTTSELGSNMLALLGALGEEDDDDKDGTQSP